MEREPTDRDYEWAASVKGPKSLSGTQRSSSDDDYDDEGGMDGPGYDPEYGSVQARRDADTTPETRAERRERRQQDRFEQQQERQRRRQMIEKTLQAAREALTVAEVRLADCQGDLDTYEERLAQFMEWKPIVTDVLGRDWPEEWYSQQEFAIEAWDVYPEDSRGPSPVHPGDRDQLQSRLDVLRQAVDTARADVDRLAPPPPVVRRPGRPARHGYATRVGETPVQYRIIYKAWENMKSRCSANPTAKTYADYYGRGIRICERWLTSFPNFRDDVLPIFEQTWKLGRKFDRIDNDGNYEPGNVEWRTNTKSNQNRRKPQ
jgi:hypothetical protein